jgi:hypothetical protein
VVLEVDEVVVVERREEVVEAADEVCVFAYHNSTYTKSCRRSAAIIALLGNSCSRNPPIVTHTAQDRETD